MSKIKLCLTFACSLLFAPQAFAAACCGGSISMPAMISGDDRMQIGLSRADTFITDDVDTSGTWNARREPEKLSTWTLDAAHIFNDRWQVGASVPLVRRERAGRSSSGLGDLTANLGYEYLPDWDYNPLRPKGLAFLQLIAPTGNTAFESQDPLQLDARGRGFWALGAGTLLTKAWGPWDALASIAIHRSFKKKYSTPQSSGVLNPGWGGAVGVGGGYSYRSFRVGPSLTWNYEDPIDVTGPTPSKGGAQRFATAALNVTYSPVDEWGVTASAQDQRVFGRPSNTSLGRAVYLQVQYRLAR